MFLWVNLIVLYNLNVRQSVRETSRQTEPQMQFQFWFVPRGARVSVFELGSAGEDVKTDRERRPIDMQAERERERERQCELQREVRKRKAQRGYREKENQSGFIPLAGAPADIPGFSFTPNFLAEGSVLETFTKYALRILMSHRLLFSWCVCVSPVCVQTGLFFHHICILSPSLVKFLYRKRLAGRCQANLTNADFLVNSRNSLNRNQDMPDFNDMYRRDIDGKIPE